MEEVKLKRYAEILLITLRDLVQAWHNDALQQNKEKKEEQGWTDLFS